MKYLFDEIDELLNKSSACHIALFLDYDGTLTPIVPSPDQAVLSKEAKDALLRLSKIEDVSLAIVSGRAIEDVRRLVGIKNIIYVGNHGFEIEGRGMDFESLVPLDYKKAQVDLKGVLRQHLTDFPGSFLEEKGITMSLHYRLVDPSQEENIVRMFDQMTRPWVDKKSIYVTKGKKVLEIRPPVGWDKGKAVSWIFKRQQHDYGVQNVFPFYFGDDVTDEDAFMAVQESGVSVCVGSQINSKAQYFVNNPQDVIRFLTMLEKERTDHGSQKP